MIVLMSIILGISVIATIAGMCYVIFGVAKHFKLDAVDGLLVLLIAITIVFIAWVIGSQILEVLSYINRGGGII